MDVSVLAAVGSFFVSERVLKPKATLLILLACVLAYDLTTKTHDVSSLRVYRGPALIAFCLMMAAYSLRTWRRNGVACDELLFLPGTPHGQTHGIDIDSPPVTALSADDNKYNDHHNAPCSEHPPTPHERRRFAPARSHSEPPLRSEGDVAAGVGWRDTATTLRQHNNHTPTNSFHRYMQETQQKHQQHQQRNNNSTYHDQTTIATPISDKTCSRRGRSQSEEMDVLSIRNKRAVTPDATTNTPNNTHERQKSAQQVDQLSLDSNGEEQSFEFASHWESSMTDADEDTADVEAVLNANSSENKPDVDNNTRAPLSISNTAEEEDLLTNSSSQTTTLRSRSNGPLQHFQHFGENHPRITRIGSFFFFRSSATSTQSAAYAPSGPAVVGAALDLSMPILFNFHLFIEAYNSVERNGGSEAPAKILPLIFLTVLIFRSMFPPGRRGRFWSTIKFTVAAPFYRVRIRDAFVGDVITSLVRPGQDILFALSYYLTVIWGTVTGRYGLSESGRILETSWLLHNVVLPSCAIIPLWWKFLQTLRHAYDDKCRWPHYANSFKYLSANIVILYGMTHREDARSPWWIISFLITLLYQIWYDTCIDWELFIIVPKHELLQATTLSDANNNNEETTPAVCTLSHHRLSISSIQPDSRILLSLQMYIFQPIERFIRNIYSRIPHYTQIQLRTKRLYKTQSFYYKIFAYNTIMRFTWMLCFIPAYRLSTSHHHLEKEATFSSDVNSYVGVLLPLAEILRRCFWGILFLEKETIQIMDHHHFPTTTAYEQLQTVDCTDVDDDNLKCRTNMDDDGDGNSILHPDNTSTHKGDRMLDNYLQGEEEAEDDTTENEDHHLLLPHAATNSSRSSSQHQQHDEDDLMDNNNNNNNNSSNNNNKSSSYRLSIPIWIHEQLQLQQDAAMTNSNNLLQRVYRKNQPQLSDWIKYFRSDDFIRQLFLLELIIWSIAFVGFGCMAAR